MRQVPAQNVEMLAFLYNVNYDETEDAVSLNQRVQGSSPWAETRTTGPKISLSGHSALGALGQNGQNRRTRARNPRFYLVERTIHKKL